MCSYHLSSRTVRVFIYFILCTFFVFSYHLSVRGQQKPSLLGNWIKVSTNYLDGSPLEEHHPLKYNLLKYSFKKGGKAAIITNFLDEGDFNRYEEKNGKIEISTNYWTKISLKVAYLTQDSLVVIQEGPLGPRDPSSISVTLVRYEHLQNTSNWTSRDFAVRTDTDTVYKASLKVHPTFASQRGFQQTVKDKIPDKVYNGYYGTSVDHKYLFLATFIVRKSGKVENIKIMQSIDDKLDEEIVKRFKKLSKNWTPAYYNNKPVDSQAVLEINFDFNHVLVPITYYGLAIKRIEKGDIEGAISYFDIILSSNPRDEKALISRGGCYLRLNDRESACEDFRILKNLGFASGEALLQKHCR